MNSSKAYLERQNARSIEDLVDFKGILKEVQNLKKTLEATKDNPAIKDLKVLEVSRQFVQASFAKTSQQMEIVKEDETRLIEEFKLQTLLEIKNEKIAEKNRFVKFIEDNSETLKAQGFNFFLKSLNLETHKPLERYKILFETYEKFSYEKVFFLSIIIDLFM